MEKSQLKIKLKIVKVVTGLEIIQPQFLIGQHFIVFDKRKLKKSRKPLPFSPPTPPNVKMTFQGTNRFLILTMVHVVIFRHWSHVRLFHLYISVLA